ncbi:hypothetical protein EDB81DRAFT_772134 [Dactylonectria macrodidyma]|uniref:Ankyrin n=1 Tax=Dactylonectria macrodidyma TaxID=307937 RepID=A0A9P9FU00_9HYPO|nr:hypothetical protein EDB81DRAFT_772134 [Dactylonectria macrodidyma]
MSRLDRPKPKLTPTSPRSIYPSLLWPKHIALDRLSTNGIRIRRLVRDNSTRTGDSYLHRRQLSDLEQRFVSCMTDRFGRTPLHYSTQRGHKRVIEALVELGTDKDAKDDAGRAPLRYAARSEHEAVRVLIELGADKDERDNSASDLNVPAVESSSSYLHPLHNHKVGE